MSMPGDFLTMAEAVGDIDPRPLDFAVGDDFDLSDPDQVEIVHEASSRDAAERIAKLEAENARLHSLVDEQRDR
ncbi:MAG: hypothetical protein ACJA07_000427 [Rhodococcus sp. (in: high G+C Gram-positive bacteria)]|jgi:hypothetical protein